MGHTHLTLDKREILERLLGQRHSIRSTAKIMGYSHSAISQEIKRNSKYIDGELRYRGQTAQGKAEYRRKRHKNKTFKPEKLISYVINSLKQFWSPEQIEGRLKLDFPDDVSLRICFKTIYRWIEQAKHFASPLGKRVRYTKYLRLKRAGKQLRPDGRDTRGKRRHLPSIEDRPEEANKREQFGHWEGDLVLGYGGKENVATFVDISTGFLLVANCKDKKKETVSSAILEAFRGIDPQCVKTITLDRGSEFADYITVEKKLNCNVFFCHPQTPNERALNEQTNGLLRQFYPKRKRSEFSDPEKLNWAVNLINHRPRKKHNYRTTWEVIKERGLAKVFSFV